MPRKFGKINKEKFRRLLKGREEIEKETLLETESSATQRRRRSTAQRKTANTALQIERRSKSTAQPQDAREVPIDRWTSGLNMPIEGNSLSMKDLGIDLLIIDEYLKEQQIQELSS